MDVPARELSATVSGSVWRTSSPLWALASCFLIVVLLLVLLMTDAVSGPRGATDARDDMTDGSLLLPPALHELSGMVAIDEHTLACVQDELGIVFLVDLRGQQPVRSFPFGRGGDYEGIAVVADRIWVLRSDGTLFCLHWRGERLFVDKTYELPFDGEFEGLCYDPIGEQLLVLPKGPIDGKRREKERRRILSFDPASQQAAKKPFVTLHVDEIEEQIDASSLLAPRRTTAKGNLKTQLRLYGTELLALPGGDLLMLSPKDRLLLRLDRSGKVLATAELDMVQLPQPEAMALLPNGQLLIGSEGRDGPDGPDGPARIVVVPVPQ